MLVMDICTWGIGMKKRDLVKWAAISDILETAVVVVSLLFVAYSINRNSAVLQAANDNFAYQIQDQRVADIANNAELASIDVRVRNNEEISEIEKHRMLSQHLRELNMWELSYVRYNQGLYSAEQWNNWNDHYEIGLTAAIPEEWWAEVRPWYQDEFAMHVDAAYANN